MLDNTNFNFEGFPLFFAFSSFPNIHPAPPIIKIYVLFPFFDYSTVPPHKACQVEMLFLGTYAH